MISVEPLQRACDTDGVSADPIISAPAGLTALRDRVDRTLRDFLADVRGEIVAAAPDAALPLDEVARIVGAGGKRLRPAFCYWGFRAAGGGDGDPIDRAATSLELLHTMALIHDDLMDRAVERRGAPSSAAHLTVEARLRGAADPEHIGWSLALLAGDLAAVLADRLLLSSGFSPDVLMPALERYHRMRTDMAAGQCLGLLPSGSVDPSVVAALKGGVYTVGGPLSIGATLGGADPQVLHALEAYGDPLGVAFQLRDDERDGDVPVTHGEAALLAARARDALDGAPLEPAVVEALRSLAELVMTE